VSSASRTFDPNRSVWTADAAPDAAAPPLAGDLTVDVAIIGGGFTGVSTAYHLAGRNPGLGIALLEARALGNGASGRSGGQMLTGIRPDPDIEARVSEYAITRTAIDDLLALIQAHGLAVRHRRDGALRVTTTAEAAEATHAETEELAARGLPLRFLPASAIGDLLRARGATGAVFDPSEGVLNGVDLIRAMRPLLVEQGVEIFEDTPVMRVRQGETIELETARGTVRARAIVLATNGYTPRLGFFKTGILPVISHVIATAPLDDATRARGFGTTTAFSDDLPRLAYASVDPAGRLVFGGGTNTAYGYKFGNRTAVTAHPDDRPARALRRSLAGYFPELAEVPIEYRWSGPLGVTMARHCGIGVMGAHRNIYYGVGYSGHGVVLANLAGRVIADLYAGDHDRWREACFYNYQPRGIPPEPMRWLGYHAYTRLTGRSAFKRLE
jgi:gamma-glutamylputrescine oxidase